MMLGATPLHARYLEAGQRVTELQFKGQDVAPDQKFRIAINNYRASGGGGFAMFKQGTRVWASTSEIRDLMATYVQAKGTIDPQAINVRNFTLLPDVYTKYFGAAPAAGGAAPAPGAQPVPAALPRSGSAGAPILGLATLAFGTLALGVALRRRTGALE